MLHKSHPIASFKALKDDNGDLTGEFEAIVSVFGNVDLVGDRVVKGAFTKSLDRWRASGDPIPVIWSHQWQDPFAHIGAVTEASETAKGLRVNGSLDMGNPTAAYLAKLLAERRVKEFSFAYDVVDERRAKDGVNDLLELDIIEVGPTLKGANPETQLLAAKTLAGDLDEPDEVDEGVQCAECAAKAVEAKTIEILRQLHDHIGEVLSQTDEEAPETDEPESEAEAAANSPSGDEGDGNAEGGDGISDLPAPSDLLVDLTADALLADVALDE